MKKNKRGFILIELLIVAVFTASLFTFLYVNIIPLMGDYDQKEKYDTIDTKYVLYDLRQEILTYDSNGTDGLWDEIKKDIQEQGFARLYEYTNDGIACNSDLFKQWDEEGIVGVDIEDPQYSNLSEEEKQEKIAKITDNQQTNNCNTLLTTHHIRSIYITRYGLGSYAEGTDLPEGYHNLKEELKNGKVLVDECQNDECKDANGTDYAQSTEEYIKKMSNFTLGYEYKKEYYRMIVCTYPLDREDTYCGTIEIMRK